MNTLNDESSKWQKLTVIHVLLSKLHDDLPEKMLSPLDTWLTAMSEVKHAGAPRAPGEADLMGTWLNKICRLTNAPPLYQH